jgi:uncharacterized membrane protein YfcA
MVQERGRGISASPLGPVAVGLLAGFLSGLFGVGGGILIVPGLVFLMRMEQRRAHGTSLGAAIPISLSAVIGFAIAGSVDWAATLPLAGGAVVGALIGTRALRLLTTQALRISFAGVMLATAVRLAVQMSDAPGRGGLDFAMIVGMLVVGLLSGTLAGLLGVGGGIVIVPALVILFGFPSAMAKGTSLAVIVPTAVAGTAQNARHRNIDVRAAALVGVTGVASAFGASAISVHLDQDLSNELFAILLALVAIRMAVSALRSRARGPVDLPVEP